MLAGSSLGRADRTKLVQVLRIYCAGLDPAQLNDLRSSLARGRYPWLRVTFARAIVDKAFDRNEWTAIIGRSDASGRPASTAGIRADQQLIWSQLFRGVPFPTRQRVG